MRDTADKWTRGASNIKGAAAKHGKRSCTAKSEHGAQLHSVSRHKLNARNKRHGLVTLSTGTFGGIDK